MNTIFLFALSTLVACAMAHTKSESKKNIFISLSFFQLKYDISHHGDQVSIIGWLQRIIFVAGFAFFSHQF